MIAGIMTSVLVALVALVIIAAGIVVFYSVNAIVGMVTIILGISILIIIGVLTFRR